MKNNNMQPNNIWLITAQLIVFSLFLDLSQLTLAKDRIQYHVQNFDGSTLNVINEQVWSVSRINTPLLGNSFNIRSQVI